MIEKDELDDLYQSLVLEHSKKPKNFGKLDSSIYAKGKNPSCGDEINLYLIINNDIVEDVKFNGEGCALCVSSASLMTQKLKGCSVNDIKNKLNQFIKFIIEESELNDDLEPLHIFQGVHNFPLRVKCVLLGWRVLEKSISIYESNKNEHNNS